MGLGSLLRGVSLLGRDTFKRCWAFRIGYDGSLCDPLQIDYEPTINICKTYRGVAPPAPPIYLSIYYHTPHHPIHVYGTVCLVYIIHVIQSRSYPPHVSMHILLSHSEHTRQRQRHEHTHTNTQHNTHTRPARHRHHLGTTTQHRTRGA